MKNNGAMERHELHDLLICLDLLDNYFQGNTEKVLNWMTTPNPLLGEIKPIVFWWRGRGSKVRRLIESLLEENKS